jgi:hypothetical protein
MKARLGALACATLCLIVTSPPGGIAASQDTTDYVVTNYELTISLQSDTFVGDVTMDLIYAIRSGTKSEGFKFLGNLTPIDLRGTEDDGRPMRMSVERQRETLIRWRFTPSGIGDKHVRVRFSVPLLNGDDAASTFNAPWAGIFKVPVERAVYRLLLPEDWPEGTVASLPPSHTRTIIDGRRAVEIEQRPLAETTFGATLRPGVIRNATIAAVRAPTETGNVHSDGTFLQFLGVAIVLAIVFAVFNAKRSTRGTGSDPSSNSSCAGGSSCSSSCGGGGCGGGCGG